MQHAINKKQTKLCRQSAHARISTQKAFIYLFFLIWSICKKFSQKKRSAQSILIIFNQAEINIL